MDEPAVIRVVNRLFRATDERDWATVERCLAPSVLFDMTSLAGGAPLRMPGGDIARGWAKGLEPITQVHHQVGNHEATVAGDTATAFCYGTAWHWRATRSGRNTRVFVGTYDFRLARGGELSWRIDHFVFRLKFIDGNRELEKEAV